MFYEILKFLGKSINVRDVIHTKRINASSALVNNQPPTHKCVGGAERVKPFCHGQQNHGGYGGYSPLKFKRPFFN